MYSEIICCLTVTTFKSKFDSVLLYSIHPYRIGFHNVTLEEAMQSGRLPIEDKVRTPEYAVSGA